MYEFEILRPTSLDDALAAMADEDNQALAGGQTLIPALKQRLAMPSALVSLSAIEALKKVEVSSDSVLLGAGVTHSKAQEALTEGFPALSELAGQIGDPAVRHRGTIGGSVANNDPSACYPAAVLACGATILTNKREIPADSFFEGMFSTALEEGELITALRFPIPKAAHYAKFRQPASHFALAGAFVAQTSEGPKVALTGVSEEGVFRWAEAEEALQADFSTNALSGLDLPEDGMIGDVHATAAYRAHLAGVMTRRAVAALTA